MTEINTNIRDKTRVRNLGEVFTAKKQVEAMINLVLNQQVDITKDDFRILEPGCGNGNFLVAVLDVALKNIQQKLKKRGYNLITKSDPASIEFAIIKSLSSIYGVDISRINIGEAKERMFVHINDLFSQQLNTVKASNGFWDSIRYILDKNIVEGDLVNGAKNIKMIEYSFPSNRKAKMKEAYPFRKATQFSDIFEQEAELKTYPICPYNQLAYAR